ncbi:MAG: hypothetical protein V2J12_01995 [Gammaproteobacteria bacterium]|jgi:hypothetical protein|nr:hypothetical protein [Gammaproteobacteria bacterium]
MNHQPSTAQTSPRAASPEAVVDLDAASRTARPVFTGDPVTDAQWDIIVALTNELGATRARLDAMERVLVDQQTLPKGAIDSWVPAEQAAVERTHDHQSYIRRVFNTLTLGK